MYTLLDRLVKRTHEADYYDPGNKIALDDGEKCWAWMCLHSGTAREAIPFITGLEQAWGWPAESVDQMHARRLAKEYAEQVREWLKSELKSNLDSVDDSEHDWRREQKVARIGFPMHLRILRDTTEGSTRSRPRWNSDGLQIAAAWGVEEGEAAWLWRQLFAPESARTTATASTRTISVTKDPASSGAQGFSNILTVSAIDWKDEQQPKHGFVPHPESFGYCLDQEFIGAQDACHRYLETMGLWPKGTVLEWNLRMKPRAPVLTGGSAGAAFALVAGSLLARRQQGES